MLQKKKGKSASPPAARSPASSIRTAHARTAPESSTPSAPCTIVPTAWAAASPATVSILNTPITMRSMYFFDTQAAKDECEREIERHFRHRKPVQDPDPSHPSITDEPMIWRYFVAPADQARREPARRARVRHASSSASTTRSNGAYIFSSGKNMGVFKANGFPEDVGEYYMLENYEAYSWTCHGRYPTNTPGWWGGAHPFALLDTTVVHNGEISSYDANRRFIEMYGYSCNLLTDTEVITYIIDYLGRKLWA